jgi:hypothetical protein
MACLSSSNSFGCAYGKRFEYSILNKKYRSEEYHGAVSRLKEKMKERGEYGKMFPLDLIPFCYNETIAQMALPLTRASAMAKGFRWADRPVRQVPATMIYTPPDSIHDVVWEELEGKVIVCQDSGRPFKIIKQEFEFYKKFNIPLPRLHWEVRLARRYPRDQMFNLREALCSTCGATVQTSMGQDDILLCEPCYQKTMV